jgi:NADPH:quinone reductase-like Zn-dependent oxidoreductase
MRAIVLHRHGPIAEMSYETGFPDPVPGPGDVIVRMKACALNYHDIFTIRSMPGITISLPRIVGLDLAGEVADLGPDVTGWKIGDRVVVDPVDRVRGGLTGETFNGGMAEYVRLGAHQLLKLPDDVGFDAAAALPCAYGTAYRMMITRGAVKAGEKVLILGASGGVGTCCVQLAKMAGAEVAVCASSGDKLERLRKLGADHLINYATEDFMAASQRLFGRARIRTAPGAPGGVDVVINFTGGDTWTRSIRCLRRQGRLLTCGATAGFDPKEDIRYIWTFEMNIMGSNGWMKEDIEALIDMVRKGRLDPCIDQRFRLADGLAALHALEKREITGKIIVEP